MWVLLEVNDMKKTLSIIILFTLAAMLCACLPITPLYLQRRPGGQLNTKWVSEDGTIVFEVNDKYQITGTMNVNGETIEFYMADDPRTGLHIYPLAVMEEEFIDDTTRYEYWKCSYISKKKCVATVKETTFFKIGDRITFHRVDPSF